MNIQQVEYVIAVSETGSFGKAAERCFITQSTLSTMIGRFEEEIGITIFDRKTKPISITLEGQKIIDQLKVISRELEGLQEIAQELKGEITGKINLAAIPTIAPGLFPLILNDLVRHLPDVKFVIHELTTNKIVEQIKNRELDIGIVSIPLSDSNLEEILLYDEPFYMYDPTRSDMSKETRVEDIDYHRLWLLEEGHCMRRQVESICGNLSAESKNRHVDYRSGSISTLIKLVNQNGGNTLLPYFSTLDLPESEKQAVGPFSAPVPVRSIGIIVHKHFVKRKILDQLVQVIKKRVNPMLPKIEEATTIISPV